MRNDITVPDRVAVRLPESLREALGQVIANERQTWRQERAVIEAEAKQTAAEARAALVAVHAELDALKVRYEAALEILHARTVAFVPPDVPARQAHVIPPGNWS